MPIIIQPPGTGSSSPAAYDPSAGASGVLALRLGAVLQSAQKVTPRAALGQASIVSGSFSGAGTASNGSRMVASNAIHDWSDFSAGFTLAWWMKPLASANTNATIFECYIQDPVSAGSQQLVRIRREGTTANLSLTYQSGGSVVAKATTDSSPWDAGNWAHYAVTFSSSKALVFYKAGSAIQFDVSTDSGGSTPSNVTSHTFNTAIPNAARNSAFLFGGSITATSDDFGGEVLNLGYWNKALAANEIAVLAGTSKLDLASNSGNYTSSSNLQFNPKFASRDASASRVVLPTLGLDAYDIRIGSTVP
jgi:hypothetical protein